MIFTDYQGSETRQPSGAPASVPGEALLAYFGQLLGDIVMAWGLYGGEPRN